MYASEANDRIYRYHTELASAEARIAELDSALDACLNGKRVPIAVANRTDDLSALKDLRVRYEARIAELREIFEKLVPCYADEQYVSAVPFYDALTTPKIVALWKAAYAALSNTDNLTSLAAHDAEIYKQGRACGIAEAAEGKVVMFSREGLAAHDAEVSRIAKRDSLVWLYSHCKAIGMTKKSLSGQWDHDIALFTTDLQTQSKTHDAEVRKAALLEAANYIDTYMSGYASSHNLRRMAEGEQK